jgi:diaminopimelate decarboxylase/aspartate kinase
MSDSWVVLKFGGTSVARAERWDLIVRRVRELLPDHRVWIVLSALSQVSNRLEQAIDEALSDGGPDSFRWIREAHQSLAEQVGLPGREYEPVRELLDELSQLLEGIRLTREVSARLRARVMSFGELASTRLGVAILAHAGLDAAWVDARELLHSSPRPREQEPTRYLEAEIRPRQDPDRVDAAADGARLVVTQGFVASTPRGETCLLGRGGSDTSAALFAALAGAERLEIWTDVHGMFSADPRQIPSARLIRRIGYRESEELAAMGAKVLHPRCLGPVAWARIPLAIRNTQDPQAEGTRISGVEDGDPTVMAVVCRRDVTLLTVSTLEMWGASGFLARTFAPFEELGISVDLVATSQSAVSVTLDHIPGGIDGDPFAGLIETLERMGRVQVVRPCAVVSIVGRKIRTVLHELGPAMSVFREHEVHMVSESSEDLNLSFVVDESDAAPLVENLHARLFPPQTAREPDPRFGPTWELLEAKRGQIRFPEDTAGKSRDPAKMNLSPYRWWAGRREELLRCVADGRARYVYDAATATTRAAELRAGLASVGRCYYSMKANPHPALLRVFVEAGYALECVSAAELARARELFGSDVPLLFTPNFCPVDEYAAAFSAGAEVTIDGPDVFDLAPDVLAGREVALRIDPGSGQGHHEHVRTAGAQAKFGHPAGDVERVIEAAARHGARVVGLHAHVGSGILDPAVWAATGDLLGVLRDAVPDLRWIDVGGGFGVVERPGQDPLDLARVEAGLATLRSGLGEIELRVEPGRYLVSECGVLLAPVTQVRRKGGVRFVGVATGMNSLLRPALYGAWHAIHNLTRLGDPPVEYAHVVGPICETGDVLGRDRLLPRTEPGDVLLIENCGAYGAVMASSYNLRAPAEEVVLS